MRDVAFGQFYPADSFVHKLDPRTKLLASIVYIVAVFLCTSYYSYLACFLFLVISIIVSRIPIKSVLKTVKAVLFIIIITVVINILFYSDGKVLWSWWKLTITEQGLIFASKMAMRLLFLVLSTSLITLTTTPMNLTDGLESLLTPLKWIKFPVHDVAIIDTGGLIKRAKALLPILIPLFVSAFRRADELAMALDARCYNATPNRTKMKKLTFTGRDVVAWVLTAAFLAIIIMLRTGFFGLL